MSFIFLAKISTKWNRNKIMYHGRPCTFYKWRIYAEAQLAGEWEGLTYPILKSKKSALAWGGNALILFIYELNFSFKMALFQKTFSSLENPWLSHEDAGQTLSRPKHTDDKNQNWLLVSKFSEIHSGFWCLHKNIYKPQHKMTAAFRRLLLIYVLVESS